MNLYKLESDPDDKDSFRGTRYVAALDMAAACKYFRGSNLVSARRLEYFVIVDRFGDAKTYKVQDFLESIEDEP